MSALEGEGGTGGRAGNTVSDAFSTARREGRAALVGYLPAGFPSVPGAIAAATAMAGAGADIVEVGLPYSDPLMDGPVIQEATHRALAGGTHVTDVLRTVETVAAAGVPTLVMTYWNPVEAGPWLEAAAAHALDPVFLVAPSSSAERIKLITSVCGGFVYAASLMGTTGTRDAVGSQAAGLVRRVRESTRLPVAVGLGVRDRAQAAKVAGFADGVIVGSAFVGRLLDAENADAGISAVRDLASDLAAGVRERAPKRQ